MSHVGTWIIMSFWLSPEVWQEPALSVVSLDYVLIKNLGMISSTDVEHIFTNHTASNYQSDSPHTCVKPSLILLCLNVLANCSSSSRSLGSSRVGVSKRLGGVWLWGRDWIGVADVVRVGVAGCRMQIYSSEQRTKYHQDSCRRLTEASIKSV